MCELTAIDLIRDYDVVVFSKPNCTSCDVAKSLLTKNNINYKEGDIIKSIDELQEHFNTVFRSAPVIVYNGAISTIDEVLWEAEEFQL